MGCGCAKKMARNRRKQADKKNSRSSTIRKRRVSKFVSIPGTTNKKKIVKKTGGK